MKRKNKHQKYSYRLKVTSNKNSKQQCSGSKEKTRGRMLHQLLQESEPPPIAVAAEGKKQAWKHKDMESKSRLKCKTTSVEATNLQQKEYD